MQCLGYFILLVRLWLCIFLNLCSQAKPYCTVQSNRSHREHYWTYKCCGGFFVGQQTTKWCRQKKRMRGERINEKAKQQISECAGNGRKAQWANTAIKKTHFLFFSSVLIKNLIEINQAIKSGHCTVGREKGEGVSSQSEKDPSHPDSDNDSKWNRGRGRKGLFIMGLKDPVL